MANHVSQKPLPAITAQDLTNLANKQQGVVVVIQSASAGEECRASPQLFFYSPEKHYWHIHLCQWHTWDGETGASVSIYTYTYCPQYGVMERQTVPPTDIRPVKENWEPSLSSKLFSASIPPSLLCTPQRGHTYTKAIMDIQAHTHTQTLNWIKRTIKDRPSCSGVHY